MPIRENGERILSSTIESGQVDIFMENNEIGLSFYTTNKNKLKIKT
jgi:hypothetical protein